MDKLKSIDSKIIGCLFFILLLLDTNSAEAVGICSELISKARVTQGSNENVIQIKDNQIVVNGIPQPQFYGAEFQYFRLRGGYGKNVPRKKVIETWERGLNQMREAGMTAISFYIPWDFHEYAPGKFDFNGTVDSANKGSPDYPSRDLVTFLKMVKQKGFKQITIRPGPYINAEWGFLGFGAIPEWFHRMYPDSHMRNSKGNRTKLYDYHNPDFLRHTQLWFEALHKEVLVHIMGKNNPPVFLQLDNETNFMWQSLYNHDYGSASLARYREFLKSRYKSLKALNQAQGTSFTKWSDVQPPIEPQKNVAQDQDWYRFQDWSIYTYLQKIRKMWEDIGVREPNVMFILAESFNAMKNGLLPNYKYRNRPGKTGVMTVNIYPKTSPGEAQFDLPAKSDHDIMAAEAASRYYLDQKNAMVIGPEIHTGWWRGTELTEEARQQTYLTVIGRGVKAPFFYYFTEGYNWQVEWGKEQIMPFYQSLRADPRYAGIPDGSLPAPFWTELQRRVDQELMVGWDVKHVLTEDTNAAQKLFFDAPLDAYARPTRHFKLIERIGNEVIKPHKEFLARAVSITDPVAILKDVESHTPSPIEGVDSRTLHSDVCAGLVYYVSQAGFNPTIHHWRMNSAKELSKNKVIFLQDSGNLDHRLSVWLANYIENGGTVISFLGDSVAKEIGAPITYRTRSEQKPVSLRYQSTSGKSLNFNVLGASVSDYRWTSGKKARPVLFWGDRIVGYEYQHGQGRLIQVGAVVHDAFNSRAYAHLTDVPERRQLLEDVFNNQDLKPQISVVEGADRVVVFGRKDATDLWITAKSGRLEAVRFHVKVNPKLLSQDVRHRYQIKDTLGNKTIVLSVRELTTDGFPVELKPNGSAAFFVEKLK